MTGAGRNPPIEFTLSHDGTDWRASRPGLQISGRSLEDLEKQLCKLLRNEAGKDGMELQLQFDMACLPRWLHQYHSHYFNYAIRLKAD